MFSAHVWNALDNHILKYLTSTCKKRKKEYHMNLFSLNLSLELNELCWIVTKKLHSNVLSGWWENCGYIYIYTFIPAKNENFFRESANSLLHLKFKKKMLPTEKGIRFLQNFRKIHTKIKSTNCKRICGKFVKVQIL